MNIYKYIAHILEKHSIFEWPEDQTQSNEISVSAALTDESIATDSNLTEEILYF
jgi:hypothetical protein